MIVNQYITGQDKLVFEEHDAGMTEFVRFLLEVEPNEESETERRYIEFRAAKNPKHISYHHRTKHSNKWCGLGKVIKGGVKEPYQMTVTIRLGSPANGPLTIVVYSLRSLEKFPVKLISYQLLTVTDMQILQV